ncbi:MAG TPA: hypothetical protein VH590_01540, partial [Ktedonobacterales bacterium]
MAGETRPSGRSRPASGTSSDTPDLTAQETDPTLAPITANTPLPPVTPLPLASQSGGGSATPQPPSGLGDAPNDQPPPFAAATPLRATDPSITSGWAARTTFVLMLVSAVLLAAMAIAYTAATKQTGLLIWVVIIIIAVNIAYPLIVFSIARPGSA